MTPTPADKIAKLQQRVQILAEGMADALMERAEAVSIAGRAIAILDTQIGLDEDEQAELERLKHDIIAIVG